MRLSTLIAVAGSGQLMAANAAMGLSTSIYRATWLAAAGEAGVLSLLGGGPADLAAIAEALDIAESGHEALATWLQVGVEVGQLRHVGGRYGLASALARRLARPENDAVLATLQEVVDLHHKLVRQTPARLRAGRPFTLADQDGEVVARSSRIVEPFIHEAVERFVPGRGVVRLLEIGCGTGTHLRYAAGCNPELTALGVELQPEVAEMARNNLQTWGLADRVRIEAGDIRQRDPVPDWDLSTLHQNIYYFPVDRRVDLLRHVAGFLRPGGRLLLTTVCRGGSALISVLDLWGAATEGAGRLPSTEELVAQLHEAGFVDVSMKRLLPGDSLFAFTATLPGAPA